MIWNETKECMSRDEMNALQGARLVKLVEPKALERSMGKSVHVIDNRKLD